MSDTTLQEAIDAATRAVAAYSGRYGVVPAHVDDTVLVRDYLQEFAELWKQVEKLCRTLSSQADGESCSILTYDGKAWFAVTRSRQGTVSRNVFGSTSGHTLAQLRDKLKKLVEPKPVTDEEFTHEVDAMRDGDDWDPDIIVRYAAEVKERRK